MQQTPAIDKVFEQSRIPLTLADAQDEDLALIRVNGAFCDMTKYRRAECVGRNCRFLQNGDRDQTALSELRECLLRQRDTQVVLRNYDRYGDPFDSLVFIHHIRGVDERILYVLGSQFVIQDCHDAEKLSRHLEDLDRSLAWIGESQEAISLNVKRQISATTSVMLHSAVLKDRLDDWARRR